MKTDETRALNQETVYLQDETACMDNTELNSSDSTLLEEGNATETETPAAKKSNGFGRRAAFGAAGLAAGAVAGAGISAMATSGEKSEGLTNAATPDDEKTPEELAQADIVDPSVAPEEEEIEMNITEESAPSTEEPERATLINPDSNGRQVSEAPVEETKPEEPVVVETPQPEVEAVEVPQENVVIDEVSSLDTPQDVNVNVVINVNGEQVEAAPVEPEPVIEVHSIGQIMDADGNVVSHAEITVDEINATLVDVDNDGWVDAAIVDADNDGIITADDVIDMSDTGLTMDDVAMNMMMNDESDQLASNDMMDCDPGIDPVF